MTATATNSAATPAPARAVVTPTGDRGMHVERIFDAPRARVWKAMTDAALVAQWWGRGNRLDVVRNEVVRGGHWRYEEHADGQVHGFEGRYAEVREPELISRTFEWDGMPGRTMLETMTLEEIDGGKRTRIVVDILCMTAEIRDGMMGSGMEGGMNQSYEALDRVLAGMEG